MLLFNTVSLAIVSSSMAASVINSRDPPASYGVWESLGCWNDNSVNRTLHHQVGPSSTNTVESCLDSCSASGFSLGGVEFGSECFCGNAILYNYGTGTACNMACSGDAGEICGGAGAINIYHSGSSPYTVGPASAVTAYQGWHGYDNDVFEGLCYRDSGFSEGGNGRLNNQILIPLEEMTVEKCLDACDAGGYRIAGLQHGQQCWCDYKGFIKIPIGDNLPNSVCDIPCTGNAQQFCGGTGALMAYYR